MSFGKQTNGSQTAEHGKHRVVFWTVTLLMAGFLVVFALKLNGYWDVSSRFDIRRIQSNRDQGNVLAVIDKDPLTVWGDGNYWEKFKTGDYLMFLFKEEKKLTGIRMMGTYPDKIEFLYKKGAEWIPVETAAGEKDGEYFFKTPIYAECLKIRTAESAEKKKWTVKEIVFL